MLSFCLSIQMYFKIIKTCVNFNFVRDISISIDSTIINIKNKNFNLLSLQQKKTKST